MCKDPAQKGLGAVQAPLTSPQEDAEKLLSLFPNLEQRDSSSPLGTVQKCCVSHCRAAEGPGTWWGSLHILCWASDSSTKANLQECQEGILWQGDSFPFFSRHFKGMNNSSWITLSWGNAPCYHLIIRPIKRDDSNLSLFSCWVGWCRDKYAAIKPEWWIIPQWFGT